MTSGYVNLNHQNLGSDGAKAVALGLVVSKLTLQVKLFYIESKHSVVWWSLNS